jgi:hypothetical protein
MERGLHLRLLPTFEKGDSMDIPQPKDTMREAADTVRDASERFAARSRSSEMLDNAQEIASDFYEQASAWITKNYGKALGIAGVLFAVGFLGYYLGKNSGESGEGLLDRMERM